MYPALIQYFYNAYSGSLKLFLIIYKQREHVILYEIIYFVINYKVMYS